VYRCEVLLGLSYHDLPRLDISTRIVLNKTTPRKIYQYHKADYEALTQSITDFAKTFYAKYSSEDSWDVDTMWNEFVSAVQDAVDSHIPVKHIKSQKQNLAWITSTIKQEIRKRNNLFKKANTSNSPSAKRSYLSQRSKVQSLIRKSYWKHLEESITVVDGEPADRSNKKFWRHIKGTKKDRVGTAPLKDNGLLVSDPKGKADILNRQYESVFTREDCSNIPDPVEPPSPSMPEIEISRHGILNYFRN
jgi:hypothetical protein